jgi:hypothetical protein
MRYAEAEWREAFIYVTFSVMRRPARRILKQADRANAAIGAEVEPVQSSTRDADQIAR